MNIPDIYINSQVLGNSGTAEYRRITCDVVFKHTDDTAEPYCQYERWITSEAAQISRLKKVIERLEDELHSHMVAARPADPPDDTPYCEICGKRGFAIGKSLAKQRAALQAHVRIAHKHK